MPRGGGYRGIDQYLVSSSLTPEIYPKAIAGGRTTRAQRAERIRQLLADIDGTEKINRATIEQMEAVNRVVQEETARQLDPMRRRTGRDRPASIAPGTRRAAPLTTRVCGLPAKTGRGESLPVPAAIRTLR